MNIRLFLGGLRPPKPSQGPGPGCAGLRPASAEVGGNPVSPYPSPRAYFHVSHPCGCAAQRRNEHTFVLGRAKPSQTLPRAGAWGNPVSPHPSSRAYVHVSHPCGCAAHRRDEHPSWEGCALPDPPAGGSVGEPGSPTPRSKG